MNPFLSRLHAHIRSTRLTRRGATHNPEDVPEGTYKEYPRMERIMLEAPTQLTETLSDVLLKRVSQRKPGGSVPISLSDIAALFGNALKKRDDSTHRNYPSGGALYPIETYLIAPTFNGVVPGIFHYHPAAHALERLWDLPLGFELTQIVPKPDTLLPSALIVFTSVWQRSSAKYGDLTYSHALLEAGHMSENILLSATALGLDTRPMAGFNDALLVRLLDLDETVEQPIHTITLSKGAGSSGPKSVVKSA